eukprot:134970_1
MDNQTKNFPWNFSLETKSRYCSENKQNLKCGMGSILNPFGSICSCTSCQTDPDCNYEEGRRKIIKYAQHLLRKPENIQIIEKYIEGPNGRLIYTKCFIPLDTKPKGCVFFLIGYATMLDRPDTHDNCLIFAENGYICFAHDHIGHGRSDGLWLYIPTSFDIDYVDKAHFIHNYCKNLYIRNLTSHIKYNELYEFHDPSIFNNYFTKNDNQKDKNNQIMPWNDLSYIDKNNKYFICGRSMGGAIATKLAMKYSNSYKGLILLCPMIAINDTLKPPKWVQYLFQKIAMWFPKKAWTPSKDMNQWMLSNNGYKYKLDNQPLQWNRKGRLKTMYELNKVTENIQNNMQLLKMDFIVLHGLEDKVTPSKYSQDLYQHRKDHCDATLKLYDKSYHLMWWEPCADQMYSDMLIWINHKCQ